MKTTGCVTHSQKVLVYAPVLDEGALTNRENHIHMRLQPQSQCFGNELYEGMD